MQDINHPLKLAEFTRRPKAEGTLENLTKTVVSAEGARCEGTESLRRKDRADYIERLCLHMTYFRSY